MRAAWLSREEIVYAFKDDAAKMIAAKEEANCWHMVGHHSMYTMTIVDMSGLDAEMLRMLQRGQNQRGCFYLI